MTTPLQPQEQGEHMHALNAAPLGNEAFDAEIGILIDQYEETRSQLIGQLGSALAARTAKGTLASAIKVLITKARSDGLSQGLTVSGEAHLKETKIFSQRLERALGFDQKKEE